MRFLGDMGIAGSTMNWLKSKGHDTKHLRDEGLQRLPTMISLRKPREKAASS